jgi:DNA-binding transcriptional MerR regulator
MKEAADLREADRRQGKSAAAFRTISEVSSDLDVPAHVLRFWESKFVQVDPLKRGGGRRYYRPEDINLLRAIRELLYTDGYTIKGVQKLLREVGVQHILAGRSVKNVVLAGVHPKPLTPPTQATGKAGETVSANEKLRDVLDELKILRTMLQTS